MERPGHVKASVIIPAYNAGRWLPETLQSVAIQGYPDTEVIIVDDGSTDNTAGYVAQTWPKYTLIRTENKGVSHARNLGASSATGDFIQFLDADDILVPGKLVRQVQMLVAQPGTDIVYSNWQRLEEKEDGQFILGEKIERTIEEIDTDPEVAFFSSMWGPTGSYLYRREFLRKVGEWKTWLPVVQDARFAWDCARAGARWAHDQHIGVLYRQHRSGSVSTRSKLAFLKDSWANSQDMTRIWSLEGSLQGLRKAAVLKSYHHLARGFFEVDKALFDESWAKLLKLDPKFRPAGTVLPMLTFLFGPHQAERIALCYRRLKCLAGIS